MLNRQKIILELLAQSGKPLTQMIFVKIMFLLSRESFLGQSGTFYDFMPYKSGPFSFVLYRELRMLRQDGYLAADEECLRPSAYFFEETVKKIAALSSEVKAAVRDILLRYGSMDQAHLIKDVYTRYPWFAINSELEERNFVNIPKRAQAPKAVYTIGYEGKSVDAFFNELMNLGIQTVIDVRANPISRKYGFSRLRLSEICKKLRLGYEHEPSVGIPSQDRKNLSDYGSFVRLFDKYEQTVLADNRKAVTRIGLLMNERPSVLICLESDPRLCHRSRLARAVAMETGLKVVNVG